MVYVSLNEFLYVPSRKRLVDIGQAGLPIFHWEVGQIDIHR